MTVRPPVLLTGAAGRLAAILRPRLLAKYGGLRSTDRHPVTPLPNEEFLACELADMAALTRIAQGCRTVLHFAASAHHEDFPAILQGNIVGAYHVFEAARQGGATRVVFASSVHAVGFHPKDGMLDASAPHRPDGLYGASKCFGEDLARLYWDKHGIECASLRIGMCGHGTSVGALAPVWLSEDDLWRLVEACLDAPLVGFTVMYGASNNPDVPWHNGHAAHIPFVPKDRLDSIAFPADESAKRNKGNPASLFIGGHFAAVDYDHPIGKR
ncbi:MAG: NAD-dependent epimerase/dehydratase family protein [Alphaproteobacteria bacterium]